jgi:hypothetical protein
MTKEELIDITLKQLVASFEISPECFQVEDPGSASIGPTVTWRFRVDVDGKTIPDPNNSGRTIVVGYNNLGKTLSCFIFFRDMPAEMSRFGGVSADADATIKLNFPIFNRSYRQFMRLREKIIARRNDKEGMRYLLKLRSIFPSTHDDELLS